MLRSLCCLFLFLAGLAGLVRPAAAQELNCRVSVNYSLLSGSEYSYLGELQQRIQEYMNDYAWTSDRFQDFERLECSMQLTFEEALSLNTFRVRLILATRRPIYGTAQSTPLLQVNDAEWQFSYTQGIPLQHDLNRYDPLASVLDFYAYLMLAYDYDSFSELGGTPHFEQARRIADRAVATGAAGWSQVGTDRGRVGLVQQMLDPRYRPLRQAYFSYHLDGLDRFTTQTDQARQSIYQVTEALQRLVGSVARSYAIDLFFTAKYQELAAVFDDSSLSSQAYELLRTMDPSHLTEYNRLVQ